MSYNVYIGHILYLQTSDLARAFKFFRQHVMNRNNVRMEFVQRSLK